MFIGFVLSFELDFQGLSLVDDSDCSFVSSHVKLYRKKSFVRANQIARKPA